MNSHSQVSNWTTGQGEGRTLWAIKSRVDFDVEGS